MTGCGWKTEQCVYDILSCLGFKCKKLKHYVCRLMNPWLWQWLWKGKGSHGHHSITLFSKLADEAVITGLSLPSHHVHYHLTVLSFRVLSAVEFKLKYRSNAAQNCKTAWSVVIHLPAWWYALQCIKWVIVHKQLCNLQNRDWVVNILHIPPSGSVKMQTAWSLTSSHTLASQKLYLSGDTTLYAAMSAYGMHYNTASELLFINSSSQNHYRVVNIYRWQWNFQMACLKVLID
jgi:hypothetical protein